MPFTTYTTKQGDRWDNIAFAAYGNPMSTIATDNSDSSVAIESQQVSIMQSIIDANPTVPITAQLPSGITLRIPIIETQSTTPTNNNLLPPWKR